MLNEDVIADILAATCVLRACEIEGTDTVENIQKNTLV